MMRLITIVLLVGITFVARTAQAVTETDLQDTWHNAMPTNHHDKMLGAMSWTTITFSSNAVVNWTWTRDGSAETHKGTYQLQPQAVPEGYRKRWNIIIIPATLAARQAIILEDVTVQNDNRFPVGTVLKWGDDSAILTAFVRESDKATWLAYKKLDTANTTSDGIRQPADRSPNPSR